MRRLLLAFSLALLTGAALVALMSRDSGYVLVALGNTTIEMSVWVAALLFVTCLYVIFFLMRLFYRLRYGVTHWHLGRQQKLTTRGWLDYAEGEWQRAVNSFMKAAPKAGASFSNYLMAARAANELGDPAKAEAILKQAELQAPKAHIAIHLTRAEIQLQNRQWPECLATLALIRKRSPRHRAMLMMLRTVYTELRQWDNVQALAADMLRAGIIDEAAQQTMQRDAIEHLLTDAANDIGKDAHPLQKLDVAWQRLPKASQQNATMILQYAQGLAAFGAEARAEDVLRTSVRIKATDEVIALYGRVRGSDASRQLATAEVWARELPEHALMQLALGRLALRCRQWEKARLHFEHSLRLADSAEANLELGRLLLALNDAERGKKLLEKGFRANNLLPALPLPG